MHDTQLEPLGTTDIDNSESLLAEPETELSRNGVHSSDLALVATLEVGSGIGLLRFEPPSVRVPDNLRVLGVRYDNKNFYLALRDVSSGRNIELDLSSPRKLAARLASYFGDEFPSAILHAHAMKMARGARDLGDLRKIGDGVTILGDDRGMIVSGASTFSFRFQSDRPVFRQEVMPIVEDHYLADPHRADWLGFTVDELTQPPLYSPREAFEILFGLLTVSSGLTSQTSIYMHCSRSTCICTPIGQIKFWSTFLDLTQLPLCCSNFSISISQVKNLPWCLQCP